MQKKKCFTGCLKGTKNVVNKINVILNLFQDLIRFLKRNKAEMLKRVQHDVFFGNGGFTLIELLVVVLIIGILAAVALPQYKKAVMQSRFTEIMTNMNAMQKSIDVYLLSNGLPSTGEIRFSKNNPDAELDLDLPCDSINDRRCVTKHGEWSVACITSVCFVDTSWGTWEDSGGTHVATRTTGDGNWTLYRVPEDLVQRKIVCQWWVNNHGTDHFFTSTYGDPATLCAEVGIR